MNCFCIFVVVFSICITYTKCNSIASFSAATFHHENVRKSLFGSTWPSDHGDISRSKFTLGAGLPANFNQSQLETIIQSGTPQAQWLYTYGDNSEFLFVIGGIASAQRKFESYFIKKLNSITLEVIQSFDLQPSLYLGGLLMHKNGNVYCVHSNTLYAFYKGDLTNVTKFPVPTNLNGKVVQTNGMLVTSDGMLVLKQWNFNLEDAFYMKAGLSPDSRRLLTAAIVICTSLCVLPGWFFYKKRLSIASLIVRFTLGLLLGAVLVVVLITVSVKQMTGPFNYFDFITSNTILMNGGGGGELKLIDPITFATVAEVKLPERCSYARMSMTPIFSPQGDLEEDAIVLLGDEHVFQLRWRSVENSLKLMSDWTHRYRRRGDGSFPGTGPAIFNNTVYFTDNTFAGFLFGRTFSLFSLPLELPAVQPPTATTPPPSEPPVYPLVSGVPLTKSGPGFFFFSAVISPVVGDVIVWDTGNRNIQSRKLGDLSLHWQVSLKNADCVMVAADKNHVYVADYSDTPPGANEWMTELISPMREMKFTNVSKHFIVLDASTGAVLANRTVATGESIHAAMIIAGANDDVFLGTIGGTVRVFIPPRA